VRDASLGSRACGIDKERDTAAIANPLSLLVAMLFLVAAFAKLRSPDDFRRELSDYELLASWLLAPLAVILPALELAGGLLTLVPSTRSFGIGLLLALLTAFSAVVALNIVRGLTSIHCACFGRSSRRLSWAIPLRNALLAAPLIVAFADPHDELTLAGIVGASLAWMLGWLIVESTGTVSLIKEAAND
jgi:hypothetical protein